MKEGWVYILQSIKTRSYYIGSTNDVQRRFKQHNNGWVKATKNFCPFELRTYIRCANLTEARKAEIRLKNYKRKDILEKVIEDRIFPWDYKRD